MDKTCCPQYTIRCNVSQFQPSKSQRKVIKKVQNYILKGETDSSSSQETEKKRDLTERSESNRIGKQNNSLCSVR